MVCACCSGPRWLVGTLQTSSGLAGLAVCMHVHVWYTPLRLWVRLAELGSPQWNPLGKSVTAQGPAALQDRQALQDACTDSPLAVPSTGLQAGLAAWTPQCLWSA